MGWCSSFPERFPSPFTHPTYANFAPPNHARVTPTWTVDLQMASITPGGVLSCAGIDTNQTATITATYSSGGVTETDTMGVTITNVETIPFTAQMLSGQVFFEENTYAGGDYDSHLSFFNADSSFEQYANNNRDSYHTGTGSWSIDASGNAIVTVTGVGTATMMLISDSSTEMQVLLDDGTGTPSALTMEKIVPIDPAKIPGTYVQ